MAQKQRTDQAISTRAYRKSQEIEKQKKINRKINSY